ncbi:MAG TPA: L-threonylcarbamoyladenylate synthase [Streptosporangiaceae bacterium]|nr:L-threonylcarbamoyladenylate synthase [Streptosporangiaceae bacterium]
MSARYDCADPAQLLQGITQAELALRRGELVVLPTDTVYGIAAEAFDPVAVDGLLKAKGRGRDMPPPVLVGTVRAAMALVMDLTDTGKDLIDEFWPGGLTLVCRSSPTLVWDLGETKGTVAVRMPLHHIALELLKKTGPLAVSSANVPGQPPATTVDEAMAQLGDSVSVYLDAGPCPGDVPSTIVDLTGSVPRLLRRGVISVERLQDVVPLALMDDEDSDDVPADAADEVPEDVPDAVPEDFPGDAGVSDEARGVAPGGAGEAQVAGEMAPGDAAGDGEDAAEQVKHVHGDAAE